LFLELSNFWISQKLIKNNKKLKTKNNKKLEQIGHKEQTESES
jgi:hypothetical protein